MDKLIERRCEKTQRKQEKETCYKKGCSFLHDQLETDLRGYTRYSCMYVSWHMDVLWQGGDASFWVQHTLENGWVGLWKGLEHKTGVTEYVHKRARVVSEQREGWSWHSWRCWMKEKEKKKREKKRIGLTWQWRRPGSLHCEASWPPQTGDCPWDSRSQQQLQAFLISVTPRYSQHLR